MQLNSAMILAAGLGTRMRPLTEQVPKPLVRVQGKPLIDYCLEALQAAGIARIVVNVHHLADQLETHLAGRGDAPRVIISDERDRLLDSGGGIKKALSHLDSRPFVVLNADSFWTEAGRPNLARMAAAWDDDTMDMLLLVAGMTEAVGYDAAGDFIMDPDGRLSRRAETTIAPFVYAGVTIIHPRVFADTPDEPFSLNLLFDRAIEAGRLHGVRLDGMWFHVGTPQSLRDVDHAIARSAL